MLYILTNIEWDTDGESVDLPTRMEVEARDADSAIDVASEITGFCIFSSNVERI